MIRALWFYLLIAFMVAVVTWVADLEGVVTITLSNREMRVPIQMAVAIVVVLTFLTILAYRIFATFIDAPGEFFRWRASGRRRRGFTAITRGLVAVAAGDEEEARKQTKKAITLVGEPPLALLLAAQASQLEGDDEGAQRYFTQMLQSKETEFLGLRGLYVAATRRGDVEQAINIAERARVLRPRTRWALNALFDLHLLKGAWGPASDALDGQVRAKLIDAGIARRRRAVLSAAAANDAERKGDAETAFSRAQDALALAPGFAPAALIAAKHFAAQGRQWKAQSLIETAWAQEPHPDLAKAYGALKPEEPPSARAKRLQGLAGINPEHPESQILNAAVSIGAGRFEEARETLRPLAERFPVARVCLLMADVEQAFGSEESLAAREWTTRAQRAPRDAHWACSACARTHADWSATCVSCGAFDTLSWQSGSRGTVEAMSPSETAAAYAGATENPNVLYRDAIKPDDVRPPARNPASDTMRDISPQAEKPIIFGPMSAPDDPGPDADDDWLGGDTGRRKSGSW
jgi:HemY protein